MAAVTVNRRRTVVMGSKRVVLADVSCSTASDTFATGLKFIDSASVEGGSAATTTLTKSGGTLTIGSAAGANNVEVIAIGL